MSKGGMNQAIGNEEQTLQDIQNTVNSLYSQYNQMGLPAEQQLFPELEQTLQGQSTPLTQAAQAPVRVATQQAMNAAKQQASGLTNPDALYQNIAQHGQQEAGLAGGSTLMSSLQSLLSLISGQQGMVSSGLSQLPGVASGYGQIATQLNPWNAITGIIQAGAQAYGASQGKPPSGGGGSTIQGQAAYGGTPASQPQQAPSLMDAYNAIQNMQPQATSAGINRSAPSSQLTQPNALSGQPNLTTPAFFGAST